MVIVRLWLDSGMNRISKKNKKPQSTQRLAAPATQEDKNQEARKPGNQGAA